MNNFYLFEPRLVKTHSNYIVASDYIKSLYFVLNEFLNNEKGWNFKRFNLDSNQVEFKNNKIINKFLNSDFSKLPVYLINDEIFHFGSYLNLQNLKKPLNLDNKDIIYIELKVKKHLSDLEDKSLDHLQDCACV